jgi:two-component system sensor histidine kinase RegB
MYDLTGIDLGRPARRLRLNTLSRLRWLALTGQATAVLFTRYALGFPLPIGWCLLVIGASAAVNIGLRLRLPVTHRLEDRPATLLLGYDLVQLSALLFLTGGLENPFSMLFLAPVMISAASLSPMRTLFLGGLTVVAASLLVRWHRPLPWHPGEEMHLPFLFSAGIWCAVVLGVAFIGVYASRVAEEARQLSDALVATELVLAREQHLTQLDGLAAAAAHELGTPLATITLVLKETLGVLAKAGTTIEVATIADDIRLLDQEAKRCRAILAKLTSLGTETAGPLEEMSLSHLLEDVVGPQRNFGVAVTVTAQGAEAEPFCTRNPGILYGLGNLVENAVDFARHTVHVDAHWARDRVTVTINDDGPGFAADIVSRLGEPYVTSRGSGRRAKSEAGSGLGLGLFIAKTLLERSGAVVTMANASTPQTGAVVTVSWSRSSFERDTKRGAPGVGRRSPVLF